MAIDIKSLNLPSLRRKEVMDVSQKRKFPPELTGNHKELVLGYKYIPKEKGKGKKGADINASFQATVKVIDSDNSIAVGRTHTIRFWLDGDHQQYADRERFAFIAACFGESPDNEEFDEVDAEQKLVDTDESNGFSDDPASEDACIIWHTRTSKSKQRPVIKDGKPEIETYAVANDFFSPVG